MRTTIDIPDALYRQLKVRAATEGRSVKDLILRSVVAELGNGGRKGKGRIRLPIVRSKRPGSLYLDNARIYALIGFP